MMNTQEKQPKEMSMHELLQAMKQRCLKLDYDMRLSQHEIQDAMGNLKEMTMQLTVKQTEKHHDIRH